MANSQDEAISQHPDLLAGVVLHTLVSEGREGMTVADIARACERSPDDPSEAGEVQAAVELLIEDGLAERVAPVAPAVNRAPVGGEALTDRGTPAGSESLVRPTRAAVRAEELSF